ncbi:MAG TPA: AsmA family protein [Candidatus Binatia bacterium]
MRRPLIFILALICGGLGFFVALNLLLSNSEALLLRHIERHWGRRISAREVQMTLVPAIRLHLEDFSMADDPLFSSTAFLSGNEIKVSFKFLPLFLYQFRIQEVIVQDAVINIIRDGAGDYNFSSLALENTSKPMPERSPKSQAPTRHHLPALVPSSSIQVINGTVRYVDQTNGGDLTIERFDFRTTDLDDENSLQVELAMAVFAAEQNLQMRAAVGPLDSRRGFRDLPFDGELRLDRFDMGKLRTALPILKERLPKALDLRGVYTTQGVRFKGTLNRPSLQGQVEGTDASFRFE